MTDEEGRIGVPLALAFLVTALLGRLVLRLGCDEFLLVASVEGAAVARRKLLYPTASSSPPVPP